MKFARTVAAQPARPAPPIPCGDRVRLAFDRASVRQVSAEGHLAISVVNLSAAGVSIYQAEEVPGWQALGLQPGQAVPLLRPPEELAKAAPTLCGRPVLLVHKPVSAQEHPHRLVVGSVGNDVRFEDGWLRGSLTLWDGEAIAAVADGSARSVSCGYAYVPVLEGGTWQGERFAGRMTRLQFNHLSVCEAPRVPGCVIGDAAPKQGGKFMSARPGIAARDDEPELDDSIVSKLLGYLTVVLRADQMEDVQKILNGQEVPNPEHTEMAGDAARRAAGRAQEERAFLDRFPEARRLAR